LSAVKRLSGFQREKGVSEKKGAREEVVVGLGEVECAVATMGDIVETPFVALHDHQVLRDHRCNRDRNY
jgi:hypothetical protein